MGYKVAMAFSKDCEKELIENGFKKTEVYLKHTSQKEKEANADFFKMDNKPFQFGLLEYWGMGFE